MVAASRAASGTVTSHVWRWKRRSTSRVTVMRSGDTPSSAIAARTSSSSAAKQTASSSGASGSERKSVRTTSRRTSAVAAP
jgi:hypothetical protein